MATKPHHLRVFLASPGDVADERAVALKVLSDLPYDPLLRGQLTLEAVAWDTIGGPPMEANLTPQEAIRRGLPLPSECDVFVAVLWDRMGTPVEIDGVKYLSGTHYEYEEAMAGSRANGRPPVLVYRRTQKVRLDPDDDSFSERLRQHRRVTQFFERFRDPCSGEATGGYNQYADPDEYRQLLETHLRFLIAELLKEPHTRQVERSRAEDTEADTHRAKFVADWRGSPFPGLRSFGPSDEPIFYGRGVETDALVERVRNERFVAVVGASGSGKSSLVGAGLIPRLTRTSGTTSWLPVMLTPDYLGTANPFTSLASALLGQLPGFEKKGLASSLRQNPDSVTAVLGHYCRKAGSGASIVLILDQFEELFTTVDPRFRRPFSELVRIAARSADIHIVLTLRGDFYGRCLDLPSLAQLLQHGTFPLPCPSVAALHEMIIRPAHRAGLVFEDGLPRRILDDTGDEPGALALMAYTLDELYRRCKGVGVLSFRVYEELRGVQGAIGERAEETFQALASDAREALPRVFRELVEVDERGTATRRRERLTDVAPDKASRCLVQELTNARLLVQSRGESDFPYVEVAHEALLRSWDRVACWIEDTQDDLRLLRQVRLAAKEWDENERNDAFLWPHERLQPVYAMQGNLHVDFDPVVQAFVRPELERLLDEWARHSSKGHRRLAIIDRLAEIGESAVPTLVRALGEDNPEGVRVNAARALGSMGAVSAVPVLIETANRPVQPATRSQAAAVAALGKLGDPRAVRTLVATLQSPPRYDSYGVQRSAAIALGRIGDPVAIPVLETAARSKPSDVKRAANAALKKIGTAEPSRRRKGRRAGKA